MTIYPLLAFRAEWIYPVFGIALLVFCWFLPYVVVSAAAVLSKSASSDLQSTVQAVRTTGEVLAQVASPPWVSNMMGVSKTFTLIFQLIFMSICSVLCILSWNVLKPEEALLFEPCGHEAPIVHENGTNEQLDMGLEEPTPDTKSARQKLIEDVALSRSSLPSSVMCSLTSIK